MSFSIAMAWTPDLQDLGPGRAYEDMTGTLELGIFLFEFWDY